MEEGDHSMISHIRSWNILEFTAEIESELLYGAAVNRFFLR